MKHQLTIPRKSKISQIYGENISLQFPVRTSALVLSFSLVHDDDTQHNVSPTLGRRLLRLSSPRRPVCRFRDAVKLTTFSFAKIRRVKSDPATFPSQTLAATCCRYKPPGNTDQVSNVTDKYITDDRRE